MTNSSDTMPPDEADAAASARPMVDGFGRHISYLRISVTDRCDLRCSYCMPENMRFLPRSDLLSLEELERLCTLFIARGIRKIRISGGEPLLRKDIGDLFRALGRWLGDGLDELTLTTNATQLARHADMLAASGVKRVNISLDTRDRDRFRQITGRDRLPDVLDGIRAAHEAGLSVKLNTVALRHQNVGELPEIIAWAHGQGMAMTLIEVMPMGDVGTDRVDQYIPLPQVQSALEQRWSLSPLPPAGRNAGPARYFTVEQTGGKLGFITPLTHNFCDGCNRIRMTCTGRIYMCLGQDDHVDLRAIMRSDGRADAMLNDAVDAALRRKPRAHDFAIGARDAAPAVARHMSMTGG